MHCEFLLVDGGKMSKSLNNIYTLEDLKNKGFSPLDYKMFTFTSHYRNKLNFTWESLESAKTALFRLKDGYQKHAEGSEDVDDSVINEYETKFHEAINDDLNMPQAMSVVWDVIKNPIKSKKFAELLRKFDQVLGVKIDEKEEIELPKEIEDIIEERKQARTDKDWNKSDELRDKLFDLGYVVKDTKNGMEVTLK